MKNNDKEFIKYIGRKVLRDFTINKISRDSRNFYSSFSLRTEINKNNEETLFNKIIKHIQTNEKEYKIYSVNGKYKHNFTFDFGLKNQNQNPTIFFILECESISFDKIHDFLDFAYKNYKIRLNETGLYELSRL